MIEEKIYKQKNFTIIISGEKIYIRTGLQKFLLRPKAHYWNKRLNMIKIMVELNEIRTLEEMASWTGERIDWVPVRYV